MKHLARFLLIGLLVLIPAVSAAQPADPSFNSTSLIVTGLELPTGVRYHISLLIPPKSEIQNLLAFVSLPPGTEVQSVLQSDISPFLAFDQTANTLTWNAASFPNNGEALSLGFTTSQALSGPLSVSLSWVGATPVSISYQGQPPVSKAIAEEGQIRLAAQPNRSRQQAVGETGVKLSLDRGRLPAETELRLRKLPLDFNPPAELGEIWWCSLLELSGAPTDTSFTVSVPLRRPLPPGKALSLFQQQADGSWAPLARTGLVSFDGQSVIYIHDGGLIATGTEDAGAPIETPPTEAPPAEQPPAEQPPAEQPPAEQPPAEQPPAEQPPAEQPPAEQPPAEQPPAEQPPAEQPPAEQPPAEQPPAEQPPAEQPPAETIVPTSETAATPAEVQPTPVETIIATVETAATLIEVQPTPVETIVATAETIATRVEAQPTPAETIAPTSETAATPAEIQPTPAEIQPTPLPENAIVDEQGNLIGFTLITETTDANGLPLRVEEITDVAGNVIQSIQTTTNPDGSFIQVVQENGQVTEISTTNTFSTPNGSTGQRTVRQDGQGNVLDVTTEFTAPNGTDVVRITDERGNLIQEIAQNTDPQGNTRTFTTQPNAEGQLVTTTEFQDSNGVTRSINQVTNLPDGTQITNTQSFDANGALVSNQNRSEQPLPNNGRRIQSQNLDAQGNVLNGIETIVTFQDGIRQQQTSNFDANGNLTRLRLEESQNNPDGTGFFNTITQDGAGNITESTNSQTTLLNDGSRQVLLNRLNGGGQVIEEQTITLLPNGDRVQVTLLFDANGNPSRRTTVQTLNGVTTRTTENFPPPTPEPSPIPPTTEPTLAPTTEASPVPTLEPSPVPTLAPTLASPAAIVQTQGISLQAVTGEEGVFFPDAAPDATGQVQGEFVLPSGESLPALQGPGGEVSLLAPPEGSPQSQNNVACTGANTSAEELLISLAQEAAQSSTGNPPQVLIIPPPPAIGAQSLEISQGGVTQVLPVNTYCLDGEACVSFVSVNNCFVSVQTLGQCGATGTLICGDN